MYAHPATVTVEKCPGEEQSRLRSAETMPTEPGALRRRVGPAGWREILTEAGFVEQRPPVLNDPACKREDRHKYGDTLCVGGSVPNPRQRPVRGANAQVSPRPARSSESTAEGWSIHSDSMDSDVDTRGVPQEVVRVLGILLVVLEREAVVFTNRLVRQPGFVKHTIDVHPCSRGKVTTKLIYAAGLDCRL